MNPIMNYSVNHETMQYPNQQQSSAQAPTNMKRRYAIIFPEGTGYFLVDIWQAGANAQTMLVKSQLTGEICVRRVSDLIEASMQLDPIPPEVENAVISYNVPRLLAHQTYPDPRPPQYGEYLNYVSIWQLCNGFQIHEVQQLMNDDEQLRVPEAVLWSLLRTGMEAILDYSSQGVVHNDLHAGNILLDWSEASPLPSFFFIDFGGSRQYPEIRAKDLRQPWTAFSLSDIESGKITDEEYGQLDSWYDLLFNDMLNFIRHMHVLMVGPDSHDQLQRVGRVRDRERHFFSGLARADQGLNGYSAQLVKVIAAWCNIVYACHDQPDSCAKWFSTLLSEIRLCSAPYCHNFLTSGARGYQSTNWMRSDKISDHILTFKDPRVLFDVGPPALGDERAEIDDGYGPANPRLVLDLSDPLKLRQGQYQVGEIMIDESTGQWQPVRLVGSMDEVTLPLSPDAEQHDPLNNIDDPSNLNISDNPVINSTHAPYTGVDPSYPERPMHSSGLMDPTAIPQPSSWLHDPFLTPAQLQAMPPMQPRSDSHWLIVTATADLGIREGEGNPQAVNPNTMQENPQNVSPNTSQESLQSVSPNTTQGNPQSVNPNTVHVMPHRMNPNVTRRDNNDSPEDDDGPLFIKQEDEDGNEVLVRAPLHYSGVSPDHSH